MWINQPCRENRSSLRNLGILVLVSFSSVAILLGQPISQPTSPATLHLGGGWALQSSVKIAATGEEISSASFEPANWLSADVPTTVVAAQVKNGLLPDPFYGMNLRKFPGLAIPLGPNFSNLPMPPDSPYAVSWWYRKAIHVARQFYRQNNLAELPRHQLPRKHFSEWKTDCELRRSCWRMANL